MFDLFSVTWSVSEISDVWSCFILWSWLEIWWCLRLFGWDCLVEIIWLIEARLALFSPHRGVIFCLLGCLKACFIFHRTCMIVMCCFLLACLTACFIFFFTCMLVGCCFLSSSVPRHCSAKWALGRYLPCSLRPIRCGKRLICMLVAHEPWTRGSWGVVASAGSSGSDWP